jgi:two-component system phosphate regulon sensor histidine kinase PhoR
MRRRRLYWRVFWTSAAIATAVAAIFGPYAAYRAGRARENVDWNRLELAAAAAQMRLGQVWPAGASDDFPPDLAAICYDLSDRFKVRLTVILPEGKVVADTKRDPALLDNHSQRPEILEATAGTTGRIIRDSATLHEPYMYLAMPLRRGDRNVATVRTSLPAAPLADAQWAIYIETAAICLLAVLAVASITVLAARPVVRALQGVGRGTEQFARGDWKYRLPDNSIEEVGVLADSLNTMAAMLDDRIQRILRQQSEHQAVLASMEEGVLAVDRTGTVLSVNDPCAELLGVEAELVCGRSVYEVLRKPDLLKFIEHAQSSSKSLDGDLRFFNPGERWLHAHGTTLHDSRGQKMGVLIVMHDVTRLRHLENVRRDFVANVSHELRTPITSIKGFVETLIDDGFADQVSAQRFLGIVLRQVNRLDAIISDLLLLSRIERSGEDQRIEMGAEPLAHVVQVARETCEKKAGDKAVELVTECPEDLVAKINGPLLEQAVINLIDNAIKYSDSGATVRVTVQREGEQAVIRVIDNGCGIAANHLPRLFERFYRVDKARSRELGGTGLGLAIVKHIMAAHQGTIQVESVVGRGSTFTLRLPLVAPAGGGPDAIVPDGEELEPSADSVA